MASTSHGNKLNALFANRKLPECDRRRRDEVLARYANWHAALENQDLCAEDYLENLVAKTNEYKNYIDIDFIFSSEADFLYRQAGQLKLNNSILEECLSYLFDRRLIPGAFSKGNSFGGDYSCYAGFTFGSWNAQSLVDRIQIKTKNQDFSIGKTVNLFLEDGEFRDNVSLNVAYFATEIKTNLDKTMFQEACATARELKSHVLNSRYYLVCEWIDMTPIDTSTTSIDKVIILRRAQRLASDVRAHFSTVEGRRQYRERYVKHLLDNPLSIDMFKYLVECANQVLPPPTDEEESEVIARGLF